MHELRGHCVNMTANQWEIHRSHKDCFGAGLPRKRSTAALSRHRSQQSVEIHLKGILLLRQKWRYQRKADPAWDPAANSYIEGGLPALPPCYLSMMLKPGDPTRSTGEGSVKCPSAIREGRGQWL